MREEPLALLPELVLILSAVAALLLGSFLPRRRQDVPRAVAALGLLTALGVAVAQAVAVTDHSVYEYSFAADRTTATVRVVVCAATLLVLCMSIDDVRGARRETELYVLLLLAALGTIIMAGTTDILVLAVAFLLTSVPSYALAGWRRDAGGTEAALKYYLLGALLGVVMLLGVLLLYAAGGATTYRGLHGGLSTGPHVVAAVGVLCLLMGLLFKAGAVPAHFWVPDVAQGSRPAVAGFLTTVPKVGALVAAFRFLVTAVPLDVVAWPVVVAVVAAATMTLGNFAALRQSDVRRLLGWSTVSQVGYLLMAVAAGARSDQALRALSVYLVAYAVTNLAAFAAVCRLPEASTLPDYRGLAGRRPGLAAVLLVALLGLVGTPPVGVFVGKLLVFTAAWDAGFGWLVAVAAVNTVLSLVYYLRWVLPVFQRREAPLATLAVQRSAGRWSGVAAGSAGVGVALVGVLVGPVATAVTTRLLR